MPYFIHCLNLQVDLEEKAWRVQDGRTLKTPIKETHNKLVCCREILGREREEDQNPAYLPSTKKNEHSYVRYILHSISHLVYLFKKQSPNVILMTYGYGQTPPAIFSWKTTNLLDLWPVTNVLVVTLVAKVIMLCQIISIYRVGPMHLWSIV